MPVLQHFGWWLADDLHYVCRFDLGGRERCFHMGFDSQQVLREWLASWHRLPMLRSCERLRRSLRRSNPDHPLAQDSVLPGVDGDTLCLFRGHVAAWESNDMCARLLCLQVLVSGGNFLLPGNPGW